MIGEEAAASVLSHFTISLRPSFSLLFTPPEMVDRMQIDQRSSCFVSTLTKSTRGITVTPASFLSLNIARYIPALDKSLS